ncbi:MAG: hypothetical protein CL666_04170 [Balneola sp.]|nr:hypothetical protein [Balneola sp.]|tara:strand:+ start:168 stop:398 length:231 start_codon:yes stop_codon:yes gene_type:complete
MNTLQTDKKELLDWIEGIEDPEVLKDLKSIKENQDSIYWDDLSDDVKEGIEKGRKDAKEGRITPHEEVRKSYEKWL